MAPENTLRAFALGAHHGYRMFECDAKLSADGVPFLLHDDSLERTTNGTGMASGFDWATLSVLDAGSWHSAEYAGTKLPSLESVIRYCLKHGCLLNIEIKPAPGLEVETGRAVATLVAHCWTGAMSGTSQRQPPPLLTSFQTAALESAQRTAPHLPRGLLLDRFWPGWPTRAKQLECLALVCHHRLWNADMVRWAHRQGWRALSYTVNDDALAAQLLAWGVDGLITDRVDHFQPAA